MRLHWHIVAASFAILACLVFRAAPGVAAEEKSATAQNSFVELLKQGFEVKATSYYPLADLRQADAATNFTTGNILVTLQKGASIAVCSFNADNYTWLKKDSISSNKNCEVR